MKNTKTNENKKTFTIIVVIVVMLIGVFGIKAILDQQYSENVNEGQFDEKNFPVATIEIAGYQPIKVKLNPNQAENTVNNFIELANSGFYDGQIFHRIINDFMIQGGDPTQVGRPNLDYSIEGDFSANGQENSIIHKKGVISMARTGDPNSASGQFFITSADAPHLDGQYAGFGEVIDGIEELDKLDAVKTNPSDDKPLEDVKITKVTVDLNGYEPKEVQKN